MSSIARPLCILGVGGTESMLHCEKTAEPPSLVGFNAPVAPPPSSTRLHSIARPPVVPQARQSVHQSSLVHLALLTLNLPNKANPSQMATLGDANTRLEEDSYVILATMHLNKELRRREALIALAWLVQPSPLLEPVFMVKAIEREFGLSPAEFSVHRHYPEDFWLEFHHQRHRVLITEMCKF
ncbi:hypothetical protein ABZP36_003669 [Zizania latifolia]